MDPTYEARRARLRADCSRCAALCCVVPGFARSTDFAIDKPAGRPCPNLQSDFRCGIHTQLRDRGFPGCTVYDCLGAGQHVTEVVLGGHDWRTSADTADAMADVFPVVRDLFELLRYLAEASSFPRDDELRDDIESAYAEVEALTAAEIPVIVRANVDALRGRFNPLLLRASELQRAGMHGPDHRGADLVGRDLRGADLRGASLRGALLVGADLRGADLRAADLIGADLRGADVRGADLRDALFLLQPQLVSARGDASTRLSPAHDRPTHWANSA
ncbi:MAG: pentapeptide repeat-containing protein [Candidatus Nanopelagicales bacterium]